MNTRFVLVLLAVFVNVSAFGVYKVGDTVSNLCWKDTADKTVCLDDYKDKVRVLLFNAGWCPPCNQEFTDLIPKISAFNKKPIVFISISGEGWSRGNKPDATFLAQWKTKHKINFAADKITFPVTGKFGDFGNNFFSTPFIPNVAIIDNKGRLRWSKIDPGAQAIVNEAKKYVP